MKIERLVTMTVVWLALLVGCVAPRVERGDAVADEGALPGAGALPGGVRVHVVNSPNDPLQLTGLATLAESLEGPGRAVRYWPFTDAKGLARAIEADRAEHPDRPVAVVAWSGASLTAWDAADRLAESGQGIDLVIVLDSNWLKRRLRSRAYPDNIAMTVLIYRANNPVPTVEQIAPQRVHRVGTGNHLAVATQRQTVEAVTVELDGLAQGR